MLPILFSTPGFVLYSYPFMMGIAWGFAYVMAFFYLRDEERKMIISDRQIHFLFLLTFLYAWVGAKVLFLLTLKGGEVTQLAQHASFWLGGGMVFYGGLIGGVLGAASFMRLAAKKSLTTLFLLTPLIPLGHAIGRIGCFMAGCCYGSETHSPLSIHLHEAERHPVQLYESALLFLLFAVTHYLVHKKRKAREAFYLYVFSYALIRFLLEYLRGDIIRGIYAFGLSTSQWVSLAMALLGLALLAYQKGRIDGQKI